ncbi:iron-containing redox enzyme family protein [Streptomyces sp. GbtcB6]|uniref:iron-containing redox enzyme family protein n=1 Tax=Streptomyces sp. GbtcB6 TaxID=2824751 RepID=UPI001C306509|nr:iron-containing redox enzyme family protein [Streptomyces sp. GbtcB6]
MEQVTDPARQDHASLDDVLDRLAEWKKTRHVAFGRLLEQSDGDGVEHAVRALLIQSAPMASTLGCTLQALSAPAVFEDVVQLQAMTLLAHDVGVGRPDASRYAEFRLLLKRRSLTEIALEADHLPSLDDIHDEMFALPAVLQALSRRPDRFLFELVGIDHAMRRAGLLPCWEALRAAGEAVIDWPRLDLSAGSGGTDARDLLDLSSQVLEACGELGEEAVLRATAGAAWIVDALEAWSTRLLDACQSAVDPERAMAALIRRRAREAAVYHHDFSLDGRSLATWLRESREEPLPLLRALARSKLIKPGDSARSPLVNGLVGARGRMFRIFSPADLAVIRRWIDHLPAAGQEPRDSEASGPAAGTAVPTDGRDAGFQYPASPVQACAPSEVGMVPDGLREAYYVLQGRALTPQTRAYAVEYVRDWLDLSRDSLDRAGRSLPREWQPGALRSWLLDRHDQHDREFATADSEELPTREAVIDSTVQLAPLTLIDGSWLQGFTDVQLASSHIGAPLFETYWDELGNGQIELNHPVIYRQVLRQMGVELPPTGSRGFAFDERIREESLRLPVYWLCLGKLPVTFLPEILGMNLAMELSGVGGSYRSARRFLKHHGFSTRFVDIHNTIDNVSTGHSAWAAESIDTYMRERVNMGDPTDHANEWERVRIGYESLAPLPSKRSVIGRLRRLRGRPSRPRPADGGSLLHVTPVKIGV